MEYRTIRDILTNAEKCFGNEDAIRYKTGKNEIAAKTYTQLKEDSERITALLKKLGDPKSHIALIGATSYLWIASYFGIVDGGNVAVPLDVSLPAEELCELIDRADVTILILDEIRKDVIEAAKEKCPKLKYILSMQKEANEGNILSLKKSMMEQTIDEDTGVEKTEITPDQLCTIMFTSGTTGKSKGVMLTHRNLVENATCLDMKLPERNVLLSVLPIHHAYCLSMDILKGISLGAIICINDSLMRVAKNIKLFKPNMILMVPLMIETFAKKLEDVKDLPEKVVKEAVFGSQFHTICSGGAYLNPEYIELFERFGIQILQGYGMTECSPVISTNVAWNVKKNSVGQLLPNCEAKTVDGELWVRGSSVMQGYYKMPEETKTALKDGWLCTGDLGYVDDDYIPAMIRRNEEASVYMGLGLAIPHGTEDAKRDVKRSGIIVMQYPDGVEFNGGTAQLVIGIAGVGDEHLEILGQITEAVTEEEILEELKKTTDVDYVLNTFTN